MTTFFLKKSFNTLRTADLKRNRNGYSSKEIADKLYLSDGTVRNYTSVAIDKLEAENRFDAWKIAESKG